MTTKVLACVEFDAVDPSLCTQEVWIDPPTALPPLSLEDGRELAWAIAVFWLTMAVLRIFRRETSKEL